MSTNERTPTDHRLPGQHALERQILEPDGDGFALVGSRCPECGTHFYPPRTLCSRDLAACEPARLSSSGTLYEATKVRVAPVGFQAPFWLGYVDLPEQVRVFAQIQWDDEASEPQHGDRVRLEVKTVRSEPATVIGPVFVGPS